MILAREAGLDAYPALAKLELLKRVIFNYVVGNADCHAKNFSLLHVDAKLITLAPVYDVLCTAVYAVDSNNQKLSTKFAMAIGGESDVYKIKLQNWKRFCELIKVTPAAYKRTCMDIIDRLGKALPAAEAHLSALGFWDNTSARIVKLVSERAADLKDTAGKL